jgi:effector-binding domain-containing protein
MLRMTLMPIGRFAAASRLSIKALRIYDQSGLLPAAYVDSQSGYRYYRTEQLRLANAIRTLRGVDLPLTEIADYLSSDNPTAILRSHLDRLEHQRSELDQRTAKLESLLMSQEFVMTDAVTIKTLPVQRVAAYRTIATQHDVFTAIPAGFARVLQALADVQPVGAPFTLFHSFPGADQDAEISMCIPIADPIAETDDIGNVEVPAGAVASIVHHGSYADMGPTYASVGVWIQEHGHNTTGPSREIYLNSPRDVAEADLLTEIQWPIDDDHGTAN